MLNDPATLTQRSNPPPEHASPRLACRLCGARLLRTMLDLGCLPLANRTVQADRDAPAYPLHARICDACQLVQVPLAAPPEILAVPGPSRSSHAPEMAPFAATMVKRLRLDRDSLVIEVGSNGGFLLPHLRDAGIPVLGIEPAAFTTETAMETAVRHGRADLVVAHDVLHRVPDLFDFAASFASILRPNGVLTVQVPHLLAIAQRLQFDAFRHDTYSYLSLQVMERVLRSVGLRVFDAERLTDHGGSLRVHACHAEGPHAARPTLKTVRMAETFAELDRRDLYTGFAERVAAAQAGIVAFLRLRRDAGRRIAAYGAGTRGTTLLNACGIGTGLIARVADSDPDKVGRYLPGGHIPIVSVESLLQDPPDDVLILPWTRVPEVTDPLAPLRSLGVQLWTAVPRIARV